MNAPDLVQLHLEQAVALALGWAVYRGAWAWYSPRTAPACRRWRNVGVLALAAALLLPALTRLVPRGEGRGPTRSGARADRPASSASPAASVAAERSAIRWPTYRLRLSSADHLFAGAMLIVLAGGAAVGLARMWRRRLALRRVLATLPVVRRLGRTTVAACDLAPVPYAARAGGRAWVVVPTDLIEDPAALRVLLAHELQHHRQRDLHVSFGLEALRSLFFWHPCTAPWSRLIEELQELACDEALLRRRRVEPRAYGELLLRFAGMDGRRRFVPSGATAASGGSARTLRRRISMLTMEPRTGRRSRAHVAAGAACLALLAVFTVAARSAVLERKLESVDVARLAQKLEARGVAVTVDGVVVEEVNRWLSTPKERAFLRESRLRLEEHRPMVEATFRKHHVPAALAAVGIVESGFRNLEAKPGFQGAGVWQFIPGTARRFGLRVEGETDERLDLPRHTEAAARYLASLHGEFKDWPLALAGYSEGSRKVAQVIEQHKSRDAWALTRSGQLGRYAATVVAAALVLEDETLLAER